MDSDLMILCCSEKTGVFFGCGKSFTGDYNLENLYSDIEDILMDIEEGFWEMHREFEDAVRYALAKGKISDVSDESLFRVFGHFSWEIYLANKIIDHIMNLMQTNLCMNFYQGVWIIYDYIWYKYINKKSQLFQRYIIFMSSSCETFRLLLLLYFFCEERRRHYAR